MPRDVVLHGALLEGTGTQMEKPLKKFVDLEVRQISAAPMTGSAKSGRTLNCHAAHPRPRSKPRWTIGNGATQTNCLTLKFPTRTSSALQGRESCRISLTSFSSQLICEPPKRPLVLVIRSSAAYCSARFPGMHSMPQHGASSSVFPATTIPSGNNI